MKQFLKYAAVGIAGYFVGFFEMRYKVISIIANTYVAEKEKELENNSDSENKEEP